MPALSLLAGLGRLQNTMALIALVAAGQSRDFSSSETAIIGGALFFSAALSALSKGRLVDIYGRKIVVFQALLLALLFAILIAVLFLGPWYLAAIATLLIGAFRLNPGALQQAL